MDFGELNKYFTGAGAKILTPTEVDGNVSHQHEFQGVGNLRDVLGLEDRREIPTRFLYLDDDVPPVVETGFVSWSDVRRRNPNRSAEYHLYYSSDLPLDNASGGDRLIVAQQRDESILAIIARQGSTIESQLNWLFGFQEDIARGFASATKNDTAVNALGGSILELIGIELKPSDDTENYLEEMLFKFPSGLPSCADFSKYVWSTLPEINFAHDDPDEVVVTCFDREELLFRTYESNEVSEKLGELMVKPLDTDAVLKYAMSVFNRRKSRAGKSLENHLEQIFKAREIRHTPQANTERNNKADFIFPSIEEYHDARFPADRLTLLGAKTTLKDRWRQVLDEGERVPCKHLITLEPAVSMAMTENIKASNMQLIVPTSILPTYKPAQQEWIWSLGEFCDYVEQKQTSLNTN